VLLLVLAYFYLTVPLFGVEAFYRCRIPALPFLYAFAGLALGWLTARRSPRDGLEGDEGGAPA
jgi:hypothetical protein